MHYLLGTLKLTEPLVTVQYRNLVIVNSIHVLYIVEQLLYRTGTESELVCEVPSQYRGRVIVTLHKGQSHDRV